MHCLQLPEAHYREKEYFKVMQLLHQRLRPAPLVNRGTRVELQKMQSKEQRNVQGGKLDLQSQASFKCRDDRPLAGAQCQRQARYGCPPALLRDLAARQSSSQLQGRERSRTSQTRSNHSGFEESRSSSILWHQ